jgi:glycosyltransferase involved in cell wall biosynthesis
MFNAPALQADGELILAVVVPCYNEEEALPETAKRLAAKLKQLCATAVISRKSKIVFVDDGSTDGTWSHIERMYAETPDLFGGIKLSKNRGHQNALLCGLLSVKNYCDFVISIDADLQDDVSAIDAMIQKHLAGCEIVYGVRSDRKTDRAFKRMTAQGFLYIHALARCRYCLQPR